MTKQDWDVLRDEAGEPITLTPEQLRAVWHAVEIWKSVCREQGKDVEFNEPNLAKSRLLGRMLIDGRTPLSEVPPDWLGAPGYHLVEPELEHYYLGAGPQ